MKDESGQPSDAVYKQMQLIETIKKNIESHQKFKQIEKRKQ